VSKNEVRRRVLELTDMKSGASWVPARWLRQLDEIGMDSCLVNHMALRGHYGQVHNPSYLIRY
jgi:hypothetical protein